MATYSLVLFYFFEVGMVMFALGLRKNQFGTKTPYDQLDIHPATKDEYWKIHTHQGHVCEAVHVAGVYRHGARNPSDDYITSINTLAATLRNSSSFDLKDWQNPIKASDEKLLNTEGNKEMIDLGTRLASRVSSAFDRVSIIVTSSDTSRTKKSARKFLQGLLPTLASSFDALNASLHVNNTLIRFYDDCEKYAKSVKENKTALKEIEKFDKSPIMKELTQRVKNKLGLPSGHTLDLDQVEAVYQYCAFEIALFSKSIWCNAFTNEDLAVMEYRQDLKIYWEEGYGYPINYEMACPLWSNIFDGMGRVVENENAQKQKTANFLFGHSQTFVPLMAALGLYKDNEPLMADGMDKQKNRSMKSSEAVPFAANLVFVLYRCNGTEEMTTDQGTYRSNHIIKLFHNENEINFPSVSTGYCPYDFVASTYANETKCEFTKLCKHVPPSSSSQVSLSFLILAGAIVLHTIL